MTNEEIIRAIKAEIERLKDENNNIRCDSNKAYCQGYGDAFVDLLPFLSDLEKSERPEPYNPVYDEAYLNEKIKKATESWKGVDVDAMLAECRGYDEEESEKPMQEGLEEEYKDYVESDPVYSKLVNRNAGLSIASHFAQWGAEHLKK